MRATHAGRVWVPLFALAACAREPASPARPEGPEGGLAVRIDAALRVEKPWLDDSGNGYRVEGDGVACEFAPQPDGSLRIGVRPFVAFAGHRVTLRLERDERGATTARGEVQWFTDVGPGIGLVENLKGTVRLRSGDFGAGKPLEGEFDLAGTEPSGSVRLRGAFATADPFAAAPR